MNDDRLWPIRILCLIMVANVIMYLFWPMSPIKPPTTIFKIGLIASAVSLFSGRSKRPILQTTYMLCFLAAAGCLVAYYLGY